MKSPKLRRYEQLSSTPCWFSNGSLTCLRSYCSIRYVIRFLPNGSLAPRLDIYNNNKILFGKPTLHYNADDDCDCSLTDSNVFQSRVITTDDMIMNSNKLCSKPCHPVNNTTVSLNDISNKQTNIDSCTFVYLYEMDGKVPE
ncbi:unnamed protein product [Trichobilharzia regenti]|nr:unnamed protein product [Trichobilharzia regenti]